MAASQAPVAIISAGRKIFINNPEMLAPTLQCLCEAERAAGQHEDLDPLLRRLASTAQSAQDAISVACDVHCGSLRAYSPTVQRPWSEDSSRGIPCGYYTLQQQQMEARLLSNECHG